MRKIVFSISAVSLALVVAVSSAADNDQTGPLAQAGPKKSNRPARAKSLQMTPEREAAALEFVREHHPELAGVVQHLKKSRPEQYNHAIRDLARTVERLGGMRDRDEQRYQLELRAWKVKSRVQLLAARLSMGKDAALEAELKKLLAEHFDIQLELARRNRAQMQERLDKLDEQIGRLEQHRDQAIDKQFDVLVGSDAKAPKKLRPQESPKPKSQPAKTTTNSVRD